MPRPDPHDLLDLTQEREHMERSVQQALGNPHGLLDLGQVRPRGTPLAEMAEALNRMPLRPDTIFMSREDWADIVKWTQENPQSGVVAVSPEPEPVRRSRFARILEDEGA